MGWRAPMTHRQFVVWDKWLDLQWNEPSRSDHYLIQIAQMIVATNSKDGKAPETNKLKVKFEIRQDEHRVNQPANVEEATALEVAKWSCLLGVPVTESGIVLQLSDKEAPQT